MNMNSEGIIVPEPAKQHTEQNKGVKRTRQENKTWQNYGKTLKTNYHKKTVQLKQRPVPKNRCHQKTGSGKHPG